ncbi:hypothetical protein QE152_g34865 [Popillia japonica]|uniref:Uncharacterized protein n=1 Tax=Popillia japonica TaxID=7064 RepID=A0AAW1ISW3_POPJA
MEKFERSGPVADVKTPLSPRNGRLAEKIATVETNQIVNAILDKLIAEVGSAETIMMKQFCQNTDLSETQKYKHKKAFYINKNYNMPKPGRHINHKGRNRRFTNPEELKEEHRQQEQARKCKEQRDEISSEEGASGDQDSENDSEDENESSQDEINKKI